MKGNYFILKGFADYEVWKCHLAKNPSDLDCQDHCSSTDTAPSYSDIDIEYSTQLSKQNTMALYPSATNLLGKCRVEL